MQIHNKFHLRLQYCNHNIEIYFHPYNLYHEYQDYLLTRIRNMLYLYYYNTYL